MSLGMDSRISCSIILSGTKVTSLSFLRSIPCCPSWRHNWCLLSFNHCELLLVEMVHQRESKLASQWHLPVPSRYVDLPYQGPCTYGFSVGLCILWSGPDCLPKNVHLPGSNLFHSLLELRFLKASLEDKGRGKESI